MQKRRLSRVRTRSWRELLRFQPQQIVVRIILHPTSSGSALACPSGYQWSCKDIHAAVGRASHDRFTLDDSMQFFIELEVRLSESC